MTDTSLVKKTLGLIRQLELSIGGHMFQISTIVLKLDALGAHPLLLCRPWLKTTNIKQSWQKNIISFRRGKTKVRVLLDS